MHLFYAPELDCSRDYSLSREEAQHCVKVLRMKEGDRVLLTDGKGGLYQAEIVQAVAQTCVCRVEKQLEDTQKRDYHIHIALAPTKNNARTEWFVEKAVEMGIDEVSLFESRYSERTNVKIERLEKVVISALKQSFKANITAINPIVITSPIQDITITALNSRIGTIEFHSKSPTNTNTPNSKIENMPIFIWYSPCSLFISAS